nr:uncharacterized protein LOC128682549 [Plodia interpunctella]
MNIVVVCNMYHRFPKANEFWKHQWIKVLRESRNDESWNPSMTSVICSKHFEDDDLYTTKGGLLRVRLFAVPKKFLLEPLASRDEHCRNNTLQSESSSKAADATSSIKQEILLESDDASSSSLLTEMTLTSFSERKMTSQENDFGGTFLSMSNFIDVPSISGEQENKAIDPLSIIFPEDVCTNAAIKEENNLEETSSVPFTRRIQWLQYTNLKIKTEMAKKSHKIKILNQKVRRLKKRNNSLKHIIETLKQTKK